MPEAGKYWENREADHNAAQSYESGTVDPSSGPNENAGSSDVAELDTSDREEEVVASNSTTTSSHGRLKQVFTKNEVSVSLSIC